MSKTLTKEYIDRLNNNKGLKELCTIADVLASYTYKEENYPMSSYLDAIDIERVKVGNSRSFQIVKRDLLVTMLLCKFFITQSIMFMDSNNQPEFYSYEAYRETVSKDANLNLPILNKAEYFEIVSYIKTTYFYEVENKKTEDEEDE